LERRRTKLEMLGEFLRESSVLVLVFSFLDKLSTGSGGFSAVWVAATLAVSGTSLGLGIWFERVRPLE
jgi:hypothetical protein